MRIGFLGLGTMGNPMARNLLELGHTVTVYNRTPGKAGALIALGATEADTVAEAVRHADVAITMLSNDAAVSAVVYGPTGLLQHLPPKSIHLCMGTIGVETSAKLVSDHTQANQGYVAAPIFGRAEAAATRHIWIMAGGPEPQVTRCQPIFEALGRGFTRVGPKAALAHALKLGGNVLMVAMQLAVEEILTYTQQAGTDPANYLRLLNTAIFKSHLADAYGGAMARPSFDPADQSLDLAASEMLIQASKGLGVTIPAADELNARLQAASARGWGEQDLTELSETCRMETGLEGIAEPEPKMPVPPPRATKAPARKPPKLERVANPKEAPSPQKDDPRSAPRLAPKEPPASPEAIKAIGSVGVAGSLKVDPFPAFTPQPPIPKRTADSKETASAQVNEPRKVPLPLPAEPQALSDEPQATDSLGVAGSPQGEATMFMAMEDGNQVTLDLNRTSHFELDKGQVWAWSQGKRYDTFWRSLGEVESTFNSVLFLSIQPHILLRPEATLDLRPTFGGGAKARVDGDLELKVSRAAAPRLKVLLGL